MADDAVDDSGILPPRANSDLVGHEAAEAALLRLVAAGTLPHALLVTGPRGIGKSTLCFRLARYLLARAGGEEGGLFAGTAPPTSLHVPPEDPVFRRVVSGGHADLMTVERGYDPRRKRLRSEIVVDDTRAIAGFARLTPAEQGWRIVVIDSADEMNRNAANALLKILEEPPRRSLLLLVSHNPGSLLPTIRSRCRRLVLQPLAEETVLRLLAARRPDIAPSDATALARLAAGSIGRALALAESGGLELYRAMAELLGSLPRLDAAAPHAFADRVARPEAEAAYRVVVELLPDWLARMTTVSAGAPGAGEALPGEHAAMRRLSAGRGLDRWVEVWERINRLFAQTDSVNLDRKQVVLNAFFMLAEAAR
jgi:DNA polymerase III subunit delta'